MSLFHDIEIFSLGAATVIDTALLMVLTERSNRRRLLLPLLLLVLGAWLLHGGGAVKALLAGANVTMMASALLRHGIDHIRYVEKGLRVWMVEREYESVRQMQGSLSQMNCADESAFERAQYMKAVTSLPPEYFRNRARAR